jgi:Domain of unknown function (DUF4926)
MIREHDRVVLTAAVADVGLVTGDVGTVVHAYDDGQAFEIEFTAVDGHTIVVATVEASGVRPVTGHDISRTRPPAAR